MGYKIKVFVSSNNSIILRMNHGMISNLVKAKIQICNMVIGLREVQFGL